MKHKRLTKKLISLLDRDENLKNLVEKSLAIAKKINPDKNTNPAQSLEELYDFFDWAAECMPWNVLPNVKYPTLYEHLDQCVGYVWFIFGQPLDELKGKGFYYPSVEYVEPLTSWLKQYAKTWGKFLSKKASWNDDYFKLVLSDPRFNFDKGWYASQNIWCSFNDFFARKLVSPECRPIADTQVVCPADSLPQGVYKIDDHNHLVHHEVLLKSAKLNSIEDLIGRDSKYASAFAGGTLTHTFLDVNDYHRYHFPVDGKILEIRKISAGNNGGGIAEWDAKSQRYVYFNETGFQMIETRDCMILDTEYGLVAVLPIGMSQVCSCNFEKKLRVGQMVKKGQPLGYFMFGGSDIVMIFQKDVNFIDQTKKDGKGRNVHLLMGEAYAKLARKSS